MRERAIRLLVLWWWELDRKYVWQPHGFCGGVNYAKSGSGQSLVADVKARGTSGIAGKRCGDCRR